MQNKSSLAWQDHLRKVKPHVKTTVTDSKPIVTPLPTVLGPPVIGPVPYTSPSWPTPTTTCTLRCGGRGRGKWRDLHVDLSNGVKFGTLLFGSRIRVQRGDDGDTIRGLLDLVLRGFLPDSTNNEEREIFTFDFKSRLKPPEQLCFLGTRHRTKTTTGILGCVHILTCLDLCTCVCVRGYNKGYWRTLRCY